MYNLKEALDYAKAMADQAGYELDSGRPGSSQNIALLSIAASLAIVAEILVQGQVAIDDRRGT